MGLYQQQDSKEATDLFPSHKRSMRLGSCLHWSFPDERLWWGISCIVNGVDIGCPH